MQDIVKLYVEEKKSTTEISRIVNKSVSTVRRILIRENVKLRTPVEGIRNLKRWDAAAVERNSYLQNNTAKI